MSPQVQHLATKEIDVRIIWAINIMRRALDAHNAGDRALSIHLTKEAIDLLGTIPGVSE